MLSLISAGATGPTSIGVPGFVAGLDYAHKHFGSGHVGRLCCSWSQLIYPAIRLAHKLTATENLLVATKTKLAPDELATNEYAKYLRYRT